jgi:hypothetical protein
VNFMLGKWFFLKLILFILSNVLLEKSNRHLKKHIYTFFNHKKTPLWQKVFFWSFVERVSDIFLNLITKKTLKLVGKR